MNLLAGSIGDCQDAIQSGQIFVGEDGLIVVQEIAVIRGHGVSIQGALVRSGVNGAGRVGGNNRVGIAGHLIQSVSLYQVNKLIVSEQEHVSRSSGIFQIPGLAVNRTDSTILKGIFLLRMRSGKFVAQLFNQCQFALICPNLQRNLFLFAAGFGDFSLSLSFIRSRGIGFGGSAGASCQHAYSHQYCHQQCNDLFHSFRLLLLFSYKWISPFVVFII